MITLRNIAIGMSSSKELATKGTKLVGQSISAKIRLSFQALETISIEIVKK